MSDDAGEVESPTGAVLATAEGSAGSKPLRMELNTVRRQGETVAITFGVTNEGTEQWQVSTFFDGPFREDLDTIQVPGFGTFSGVPLAGQ